MASTYGWVTGSRGSAHRCGGKHGIEAKVQTWQGNITVFLTPDGRASISIVGDIEPEIDNRSTRKKVFARGE